MAKPSKKVGKDKKATLALKEFVPATDNQRIAVGLLEDHQVVIMEGLAGTGKTYIAVWKAIESLISGKVDKIIFTRPLTTVGGEKIGYLPGDVDEKTRPYAEQFAEYLEEFSPMLQFEDVKQLESKLEFIPMAFLRGRNFRNSIIIADEMQNSSSIQMKTLLTRVAEGSQLIILGDTKQQDIPSLSTNGLSELLYLISSAGKQSHVGHVKFGVEDIQRGEFVKFIMRLYGDY